LHIIIIIIVNEKINVAFSRNTQSRVRGLAVFADYLA